MDSSWTRKRSSSGCRPNPSFREHSCLISTLRTRCCRSIWRRRCSLKATAVSVDRERKLASSSASVSNVAWWRNVSFSCSYKEIILWRKIQMVIVNTCRCKCLTKSPNPISGIGMKFSGSGFSAWACFQMRESIPAGGVARYSRNWSAEGRTRGTQETTPAAVSWLRTDCIIPADGFHSMEESSIAGALCIAPVADRSWTHSSSSVFETSKLETASTLTLMFGRLPRDAVIILTSWAWSRLKSYK